MPSTRAQYRVLMASSEVVGFAKTGGLADVVGALPRVLAQRGHECAVILPLYRAVRTGTAAIAPTGLSFAIPLGPRTIAAALWRATLPGSAVPVYLIEQPELYERDDAAQGRSIYQFTLPDGRKVDYPDNCERYAFFCRAILEAMRLLDFWPDVLHNHDWQTGLAPVYLAEFSQRHPDWGLRRRYEAIRTFFTIHNIAYQGLFPPSAMTLTGLDWRLYNHLQLEFHGHLSFLKAALVFSQILSTVSPTYAREIQTPYYSHGLQGVLLERKDRLYGIVNGVDYDIWNPATDRHLAANYDAATIEPGKPRCKEALQKRYGLSDDGRAPLLGMIARLVDQKGIDLVARAADYFLQQGAQLVVLGEGDPYYHQVLTAIRQRYPRQVGLTLGYDAELAHQIEAGADIYLMPSLYEPSGLNQLYSLKYGTVPVVRATGGLADTIVDCTPETLASETATGFRFVAYTPGAFLATLQRAMDMYRHSPALWRQLIVTGMRQDWSWDRSAAEYERLYEKLLGR